MSEKNKCPLGVLEDCLNLDSRDWSSNNKDAWIYGIIVGWDKESLIELSNKYGWSKEDCEKLEQLHFNFNGMKHLGQSSSDLKSVFHGEFFVEIENYDDETGEDFYTKKMIDWTTLKDIFKSMSNYVKTRSKEDYRP